jgi:hypothetical protein
MRGPHLAVMVGICQKEPSDLNKGRFCEYRHFEASSGGVVVYNEGGGFGLDMLPRPGLGRSGGKRVAFDWGAAPG